MDLFCVDFIEAALGVSSTLGLKIHFGLKLTNCVGEKPRGSMSLKRTRDIA